MSRNQREGYFIGCTRGRAVRSRRISVVSGMGARCIHKLRTAERRLPWIKPIPWPTQSAMHHLGARMYVRTA